MLNKIILALYCITIEPDNAFVEKLTFYENRITSEKKIKLKSYTTSGSKPTEPSPWIIDNEKLVNYNISEKGLYNFSVNYKHVIENKEIEFRAVLPPPQYMHV